MDFIPDTASIDGLLLTGASLAFGWKGGAWVWSFLVGLIGKVGKGSAPNVPVA